MKTVLRPMCPRHGRVLGLIQRTPDGRLWLNEKGRQIEGELLRFSDPNVVIGVRCPRCRRGYQEVDLFDIQEAISEGRNEVLLGSS